MSHKQPFDIRGLVGSYADLARPENDTNRFALEDLTNVMSEVVIKIKMMMLVIWVMMGVMLMVMMMMMTGVMGVSTE